jgi:hypothetical protein
LVEQSSKIDAVDDEAVADKTGIEKENHSDNTQISQLSMAEVSNEKTVASQRGNDSKTVSEKTQAAQSSTTEAGSDLAPISKPAPVIEKITANTQISYPNVAEVGNDETVAPQRGNDTKTIAENTQVTQSSTTEAGSDQTAISKPAPVTEKIAANTIVLQQDQAHAINEQEVVDTHNIQQEPAIIIKNPTIHQPPSKQLSNVPIKLALILSGSSPKVQHVFEYTINSGPAGTGQKKNTALNPGSNNIEAHENARSSSMADYTAYNHFLQDISLIVIAGIVFIGILGFYRRRESN